MPPLFAYYSKIVIEYSNTIKYSLVYYYHYNLRTLIRMAHLNITNARMFLIRQQKQFFSLIK